MSKCYEQMLVPVEYRIEMLETEVKQCQQKVKELEARWLQLGRFNDQMQKGLYLCRHIAV
jgi:hypothetical protein